MKKIAIFALSVLLAAALSVPASDHRKDGQAVGF
jgi:hypothetical protein